MHRALRVHEVLLMIFRFIKDGLDSSPHATLAALARSSRAFKRPAEEVLWSELQSIKPFYPILPVELHRKQARMWSLTHRTITGADWSQFMERAGLVRAIRWSNGVQWGDDRQGSLALFVVMARLPRPILLTPNLRELKWAPRFRKVFPAIRLFIGPSLLSLELDADSFLQHAQSLLGLGDACPKLRHFKISGNCRNIASMISRVICGLHLLETASCSTLNDDALVHLAGLVSLRYLALDLRWSDLQLAKIQDHLPPGSFRNLETLQCKDYNLTTLSDIFLLPDFSPTNILLETEAFCTHDSFQTFLRLMTSKFENIQCLSLVHDIHARKRFGFLPGSPGRDNTIFESAMEPLLSFKNIRKLRFERLGYLALGEDLVNKMGSSWPKLEELSIVNGTLGFEENPTISFECFLSLLERCPNLRDLGLCIRTKDILQYADTGVQSNKLTRPHLKPSRPTFLQPGEVAGILLRILPELTGLDDEDCSGKEWAKVMRCVDKSRADHKGR